MDRKTTIFVVCFVMLAVGAAAAIEHLESKRADLERDNIGLTTSIAGLKREVDTAARVERSLRADVAQQADKVAETEQRAAKLQRELDVIKNPPEDKPTCFDSDAKYGADAIYVRGTLRVGNGTVSDHCRLDKLVEFSCIENPPGSGRFIRDATIVSCPGESRCVDGECLR